MVMRQKRLATAKGGPEPKRVPPSPAVDRGFCGNFGKPMGGRMSALDGRYAIFLVDFSVELVDLFNMEERTLAFDFSTAFPDRLKEKNSRDVRIREVFFADLRSAFVLFADRYDGADTLAIAKATADFNTNRLVVGRPTIVSEKLTGERWERIAGADSRRLEFLVEADGRSFHQAVRVLPTGGLEVTKRVPLLSVGYSGTRRMDGGFVYSFARDPATGHFDWSKLLKTPVEDGKRAELSTALCSMKHEEDEGTPQFWEWVGRTFVVVQRYDLVGQALYQTFLFDLETKEWRNAGLRIANRIEMLASDGENTIVAATFRLYGCLAHTELSRYPINTPDSLGTLCWMAIRRYGRDARNKFRAGYMEFVTSQLPRESTYRTSFVN